MNPPRPIPYGFREMAMKSNREIINVFHCSTTQIKRWRTELGINVGRTKSGRQVCQIHEGEIVGIHRTICSAARSVGGNSSNIVMCARGKISTAYGYQWRYAE